MLQYRIVWWPSVTIIIRLRSYRRCHLEFCIMCEGRGGGDTMMGPRKWVWLNVALTVLSSPGRKKYTYIYFARTAYFISMLKAISFTCMTHVTFDIIICHTLCVVNMHFRNVWLLVWLDSKASSCRLKLEQSFLNTSDTTRLKTSVLN